MIVDSGASVCISHDRRDFVGPITKPGVITKLQGIAKGLKIEGQGHVLWTFHDAHGQLRSLKLPAYYVPSCKVRLLSTSAICGFLRSVEKTNKNSFLLMTQNYDSGLTFST